MQSLKYLLLSDAAGSLNMQYNGCVWTFISLVSLVDSSLHITVNCETSTLRMLPLR